MIQTLSEENYLKAIYHLEKQGNGKVSATAIADELTNNPASVIDMLKNFRRRNLFNMIKGKGQF
jgi:DtxR family Mn-dependent transcriptional regulator